MGRMIGILGGVALVACTHTVRTEYAYRLPAGTDPEAKACAVRCLGYEVAPLDYETMSPGGNLRGERAAAFVQCLEQCEGIRISRFSCEELPREPGTWCYPVVEITTEIDSEATGEAFGEMLAATARAAFEDEDDSSSSSGRRTPASPSEKKARTPASPRRK